jgi:hypothetical protein
MTSYAGDPTAGCFADPPHSADASSKGRSVSRRQTVNRPKLFSILASWRGPWLLAEDDSRMVRFLALCYRLASQPARMAAATNRTDKELVLWRERKVL